MAISNYSELQTAVYNWLVRTGDTDIIERTPEFIALAEAQFTGDIKHRKQETQATITLTGGVESVALPSDYLELRSAVVQSSPKSVLTPVTPNTLALNWSLGTSGIPSEYALIGDNLHVGQLPDAAYGIKITYYAQVPPLSDDAPTNWLLTYAIDVYLYGTLMQAAPYLKDTQYIQTWATFYDRAINRLEGDQERSAFGAGPLVSRVDVTVR